MKKSTYLLNIALAGAFLASCDVLDQYPSTSRPADEAIETVSDLSNAVNGVYYVATYGYSLTMAPELAIYADLCGPDSYQPNSSGQNAARIAEYALTPNETFNAYYYLYAALANVNKALESGALLEDQEGAAPYMAELYGLRGLLHFHLATFFCPIPTSGSANTMGLVLSDRVFPTEYVGARASLDETYSKIVSDLTRAIDSGENKGRNTGHLNYWAALALRARAYLYMGEYDLALADCKSIIGAADSPYSLYTLSEYAGVWSQEGTSEMLLEYIQTDNYNAQRNAPGYYTSVSGYGEYGVSPDFFCWMRNITPDADGTFDPEENNSQDVRSQVMEYQEILNSSTGEVDNSGYFPLKYPGKSGSSIPQYTNNIKVIRLSEVYLIAAEAALKATTPDQGAADGYINTLRRNRITGYQDVSGVTLDDILDERRKELFAEGHIAFDYWRTGKTVTQYAEGTATPNSIAPTDNRTVLPLPTEEINVSNGVLIQNPGYGN